VKRGHRLWAALFLSLWLSGCSSLSTGPVVQPDIYPDRSEAPLALHTFLFAWNQGDVPVLQQVLGAWLHYELADLLKKQSAEDVSTYYRQDAQNLAIQDIDWRMEGEGLAYVRLVLSSSSRKRVEVDFSLLHRPDGWVVSGKRFVR
jgi:hypothetical protein